jgi:6-methylsalicylate decarboxylase
VVTELVLNGTLARCPDLRLIIPHTGATLPVVADRVRAFAHVLAPGMDVLGELGRLHFDLAGFAAPRQLDALLTLTTFDHLHYGSDFPFTPEPMVAEAAEQMDCMESLVETLRANTVRLFADQA